MIMADRNNWERERMRDRGHEEGNREDRGRGREDFRDDWERQSQFSAEERNRPWGREGRQGYGGEEWNRGRGEGYGEGRGGYGGGEGRWNEGRSSEGRWNQGRASGSEYEGWRGNEGERGYEGLSEGFERGNEGYRQNNEGYRQNYRGNEGARGYERRGDYGPGAFTRQFRQGTEYFGTGQRGFGTTWGGQGGGESYAGWGAGSGLTGGMGSYGEQGRFAGRGPKGYQRSDDRIREDVCERLTHHPEIDAGEIEIQVRSGEVTLTGTVNRREEKRMAEDVAESVSGVKDVHNQLRAQSQPQGVLAGQGTQGGSQANRETTTKTK
jgi:hypothetical protein